VNTRECPTKTLLYPPTLSLQSPKKKRLQRDVHMDSLKAYAKTALRKHTANMQGVRTDAKTAKVVAFANMKG